MTEEEDGEAQLPNLRRDRYRKASDQDPDYNCIAWAAGDDSHPWAPFPAGGTIWPRDLLAFATLPNVIEIFRRLDYEESADASLEPGFETIAIYAEERGTHGLRWRREGRRRRRTLEAGGQT